MVAALAAIAATVPIPEHIVDVNDMVSDPREDRARYPYYHLVPKDPLDNIRFRRHMVEWGGKSRDNAHQLWMACKRDPLFYINTFAWTYDPDKRPRWVPFNTYPIQDRLIAEIRNAVDLGHDLWCPKSRREGLSWIIVTIANWYASFHKDMSILLVSRNERYVDDSTNPKSLFWKIDGLLERLPTWLPHVPKKDRKHMSLYYRDTHSVIDGESTTGDVARGDRRDFIGLDEHAAFDLTAGYEVLPATQAASKCRIFISTPKGPGNAFASLRDQDKLRKFYLHWSDNPDHAAGLYTAKDDKLEILDAEYRYPADYPYVLDGKLRSPYYDAECDRAQNKAIIAQELDIDFLGSGSQLFDPEVLRAQEFYTRDPFRTGEISYDLDSAKFNEFVETSNGKWSIWCNIDAQGNLPQDRPYVIGVDVAQGTGASNSVINVTDGKTGEQIAEYVDSRILPDVLAELIFAMGDWLSGEGGSHPLAVIEANGGAGTNCISRLVSLGYQNVFCRCIEDSHHKKQSDKPGWWSSQANKKPLLLALQMAMSHGKYTPRSLAMIRECGEYMHQPGGSVAHAKSVSSMDPSGARENHGDRVIAAAMANRGIKDVQEFDGGDYVKPKPPFMSIAWNDEYHAAMEEANKPSEWLSNTG